MTPDPRVEAAARALFADTMDDEDYDETMFLDLASIALAAADAVDPLRQQDLHARFKALAAAMNETTDGMLSILDDMEAER